MGLRRLIDLKDKEWQPDPYPAPVRRQDRRDKKPLCRAGVDPFGLPCTSPDAVIRQDRTIPAAAEGVPTIVGLEIPRKEGSTGAAVASSRSIKRPPPALARRTRAQGRALLGAP